MDPNFIYCSTAFVSPPSDVSAKNLWNGNYREYFLINIITYSNYINMLTTVYYLWTDTRQIQATLLFAETPTPAAQVFITSRVVTCLFMPKRTPTHHNGTHPTTITPLKYSHLARRRLDCPALNRPTLPLINKESRYLSEKLCEKLFAATTRAGQ